MEYKFINTDYLNSVSGDDAEVINEIVQIFKDQCIEIYNEMLSLNSSKDYLALGLLAHKVKSSVSIMGMNDLAVMLKTFELDAKNSVYPEKYGSYISRFKTETDLAIVELDDLVNTRLNKI